MWYCPLGFLMTFIIGLFLSFCLKQMFKKQKIELDLNLFFPIIAKRIHRRQMQISDTNSNDILKDATTAPRKYIFGVSSDDIDIMEDINTSKV